MPATNLKSVSFKTLSALSASQRVKAFNSPDGRVIFSLLTPTQFAALFPLYYMRQMPDASGFMKALPTSYTQAKQKMYEQQMERTVAGAKAGRTMGDLDPSTVTKTTRTYETFKKDRSKPSVDEEEAFKATKEEMDAYKKVQAGAIATDSAEAKVIGQLSAEQLSALHVEKYTDPETKKEMYRYNPPKATPEEAKAALEKGQYGYQYEKSGDLKKGLYSAFLAEGFSPQQTKALMGEVSRENSFQARYIFGTHPEQSKAAYGRENVGMFSWGDPARHAAFMKYMQENGGLDENGRLIRNQNTLRLQARFSKQEMQNYSAGREFLANKDIDLDHAGQLMGKYIGWDIAGRRHDLSASLERRQAGYNVADDLSKTMTADRIEPKGPGGTYTKEQIDEQMVKLNQAKPGADQDSYAKQMFEMHKANANKPDAPQVDTSQIPSSTGAAVSQFKMDSGGWIQPASKDVHIKPGNEKQCVTLSRAFNNELPSVGTNGWKVSRNDSAIQPGVVVATNMYNSGRASAPGQGFHTGVALTRPDKNGNFWMLDQSSGGSAMPRQQNVNNYNYHGKRSDIQGNFFGVVNGNTKQSREAIALALNHPGNMPRDVVEQLRKDYENVVNNPQQAAPVDKKEAAAAAQRPVSQTVPNDATFQPRQTESKVSSVDVQDEKGKVISGKVETKDAIQQKVLPTDPSQPAPEGYYWNLGNKGDKPKLISRETGKEVVRETAAAAPTSAATVTTPTTAGTPTFQPTQTQTKVTTSDVGTKPIVETKPVSPTEPSYTPGTPAAKAWENRPKFGEQTPTPATTATPGTAPAPTPATTATPGTAPAPTPATTATPGTAPAPTPATTATPAPAPPAKKEEPKAPTAAATPTPAPTPPEPPKKEEPKKQETPAPAHAGGGREKVDGPLSFADMSPQRGDNTLVSDTSGKQFTMNKDKEVLQVNPNTNMVDIKPTTSATIQAQSKVQTDMNPLPPTPPTPPMMAPTSGQEEQKGMQMTGGRRSQSTNSMQPTRDTNLIPELMDQSRQLLKNPSAMRAFARAGFGETGDVLDGNKHTYGNNSRA